MKNLLIVGAGTAGTTLANRLVRRLPDWRITIVDPSFEHVYQPGLLYLPFGARNEDKMLRPRETTLDGRLEWITSAVAAIEPERKRVLLEDRVTLEYDILVIASGSHLHAEETAGLSDGARDNIFDYYTLSGAQKLRAALAKFNGGRLVLNVVEMPIKCPVAPLEFLFLADAYFQRRGIRDRVELVFATPLDGAFTRPVASQVLGSMLERKGIEVVTDFSTSEVEDNTLRSYDEREVPFDLLVTIPTHKGASFIERSGLGDELAFVPTDKHSLRAKAHEDIYVIGDATDLPSSKAGSVAHFEAEVLEENLVHIARGESPVAEFDGHANCFVESGFGKAMLIDFNYDIEPLPGRFPLAAGPFSLLKETRLNHAGKLAFRWMYWHRLLPGKSLFIDHSLSMRGKREVQVAV